MSSTLIVLISCVALVSAVAHKFDHQVTNRRYPEGKYPSNFGGPYTLRKFAKQDPNREAYHGSSSSSEEHEHEHFKEGRWARPKANFRFSSDESSKSVEAESSTSSEPVKQDGDRPEPLKVIHERIHQKYVKAHANDEQP